MKKLGLILLFLVGCDPKLASFTEPECGVDDGTRARFIVDCSTAANPKSDEEGEDLVHECGKQAERLFCPRVKQFFRGDGNAIATSCTLARSPAEKKICQ